MAENRGKGRQENCIVLKKEYSVGQAKQRPHISLGSETYVFVFVFELFVSSYATVNNVEGELSEAIRRVLIQGERKAKSSLFALPVLAFQASSKTRLNHISDIYILSSQSPLF